MTAAKRNLLLIAIFLVLALIFGCADQVEQEEAEPVEEADDLEEEEKEDGEENGTAEKPGGTESIFEHEVEKEINGEVKRGQGEEWWKMD